MIPTTTQSRCSALEGVDRRIFDAFARGTTGPAALAEQLGLELPEVIDRLESEPLQRAIQALREVHALMAPFRRLHRQQMAYAALADALQQNPTPAVSCRIASQLLADNPVFPEELFHSAKALRQRTSPKRPQLSEHDPQDEEDTARLVTALLGASAPLHRRAASTPSLREGAGGRVPGSSSAQPTSGNKNVSPTATSPSLREGAGGRVQGSPSAPPTQAAPSTPGCPDTPGSEGVSGGSTGSRPAPAKPGNPASTAPPPHGAARSPATPVHPTSARPTPNTAELPRAA